MPEEERSALLRASVGIIQFTHLLAIDDRVSDWQWYFRGYVQWHSIAIVVAELSWNTNTQFVDTAWQVMDPVLADWDAIYKTKRDEAAWDHVNALIERARYLRRQRKTQRDKGKRTRTDDSEEYRQKRCGSPVNAKAIMPIHENASEYPAYYGNSTHQKPTPQSNSIPTPGSHGATPYTGPSTLMNFDANLSPSLNVLDSIDLSAFDQVFGGGSWDFLDPLDDVNMHLDRMDRCQQIMDTGE